MDPKHLRQWQLYNAYGFHLRGQTDRYAVLINGGYDQIGSFESQTLSPTKSFEVTKSGLTEATAETLADKLVDVNNPSGRLVVASSIPNLI